jgi:tetratricopeptide (TPR) repeat protein
VRAFGALLAILLLAPAALADEGFEDAFERGRESMRARDYAAAAGAFEQATRLRPEDTDAWFRLGLARSAGGQPDAAIAAYERAAALDPAHAKARNNIANVQFRRGEYEQALAGYEAALAIDPDYLLALYHQGWVLRHFNRNDEAEAAFAHCLRLEPSSSREAVTRLDCLFFLGTLRFRAEDYMEAARAMEQVLAAHPGHTEAHYYLAMSYRRLGRTDEAREHLEIHRRMLRDARRDAPVERIDP